MCFLQTKILSVVALLSVVCLLKGCTPPADVKAFLQGSSWSSESVLGKSCTYYREDGYVELYRLTPSKENDLLFLQSVANNTYSGNKEVLWVASLDGGVWDAFRGMRFGTITTPLISVHGAETLLQERPQRKTWFHIEVIDNDTIDIWDFRNDKKEEGAELRTKIFTRVENCNAIAQQLPIKPSELKRPIW